VKIFGFNWDKSFIFKVYVENIFPGYPILMHGVHSLKQVPGFSTPSDPDNRINLPFTAKEAGLSDYRLGQVSLAASGVEIENQRFKYFLHNITRLAKLFRKNKKLFGSSHLSASLCPRMIRQTSHPFSNLPQLKRKSQLNIVLPALLTGFYIKLKSPSFAHGHRTPISFLFAPPGFVSIHETVESNRRSRMDDL
jgi:hypothetical protein